MLVLIFILGIILCFLCILIKNRAKKNEKGLCRFLYYDTETVEVITGVGCVMIGLSAFICCILLAVFSDLPVIDKKIALYEEENATIESRIVDTVSTYMEYEKDTYSQLKINDAIAVITSYPELKSDELVKSELNIYIKNRGRIIKLKEEKINGFIVKWWIYFGGN